MTVYIRPNGDDENDGSENTPVKSPKRHESASFGGERYGCGK